MQPIVCNHWFGIYYGLQPHSLTEPTRASPLDKVFTNIQCGWTNTLKYIPTCTTDEFRIHRYCVQPLWCYVVGANTKQTQLKSQSSETVSRCPAYDGTDAEWSQHRLDTREWHWPVAAQLLTRPWNHSMRCARFKLNHPPAERRDQDLESDMCWHSTTTKKVSGKKHLE